MGRFKKLVESEEAMKKFIVDYKIPSNVGLRYCKEGEWHIMRQEGEVVIPIIAFLEGGMRIPMGPVMRDYLRHFRLAPIQCAINVFRTLGCVDALNEKMGLRLTHHDINCCYNLQYLKGKTYHMCCEILKYSQVYEPYRSIVGQERGQTHRDLNERRKIN